MKWMLKMDLRAALIICKLILEKVGHTTWAISTLHCGHSQNVVQLTAKIFLSGSCCLSMLTRSITNWELSLSSCRDIIKRLSFMWHRWAWSKAWQVLQGREARSRKTKPCIQTKEITLGFVCHLKTLCYFLWWILLLEVAPLFFLFRPSQSSTK